MSHLFLLSLGQHEIPGIASLRETSEEEEKIPERGSPNQRLIESPIVDQTNDSFKVFASPIQSLGV